ncbi:DUF2142 domain-containing protein, partial [Vibrio sp. 10N.222.48.A4]|uniref:DUF2142 domain-containing protein n=1 Tax=Vibrio sp. 10N.222.48.A4 TaxID=3229605 RepID=UPI00354DBA5E
VISRFKKNKFYSYIYILLSFPLMIYLAFQVPAFQVADEGSHYQRAYQVSQGELFPQKKLLPNTVDDYTVGGTTSPEISQIELGYLPIAFKPDMKVDTQLSLVLNSIEWGGNSWGDTRNVSIYPPFLYTLSSLGIILGKSIDLSVSETLILSRILNGSIAILLSAVAIYIANKGVAVLFSILMLPMTISQMASVSPDAISFPLAALFVAMVSRFDIEKNNRFKILLIISSVFLVVISMTRPPYIALSMVFFVFSLKYWSDEDKRIKLIGAFLISFISVVIWSIYLTFNVSVPFGPEGVSYLLRVEQILSAPFSWFVLLFNSFIENYAFYAVSFIGKLGYLDVKLPIWYYFFAGVSLFLIFYSDVGRLWGRRKGEVYHKLLLLLVIIVAIFSIFLVLSISWTPMSSSTIQGVQGRYFIPISLFLCLLCEGEKNDKSGCLIQRLGVFLFGFITILVVPLSVFERYY